MARTLRLGQYLCCCLSCILYLFHVLWVFVSICVQYGKTVQYEYQYEEVELSDQYS